LTPEPLLRVGLLIPSSNTMMEVDFVRGLPPHAALHTARMFMEDTTPEGERRMLDEFTPGAARDLATARPDVVVFGCTSAGALRGNDYDTELCAQISELTGAPTLSTIRAVRGALAASGAKRLAVITPYVDELNDKIKESLESDGLEVVRIVGLGITENFEIARVPREAIIELATSTVSGIDVDLLFASCTNFPAMQARDALSQTLGMPVVTSNQAVLAAAVSQLAELTST
jgi:maleate isomerase